MGVVNARFEVSAFRLVLFRVVDRNDLTVYINFALSIQSTARHGTGEINYHMSL